MQMMIIAESGASKTAWRAVCADGRVRSVQTEGLSPTCLDREHCMSIVRKAVPQLNPEGRHVDAVFFYGAGLVSEESCAPIHEALEMWCPLADIRFHSDLLAAARALFGDGDGIVAIMGTGSNSCLYSGGEIVSNFCSGGFIIGDEGSGSALGRALISDYIKNLLPEDVMKDLDDRYGLTYQQIVRRVYKEPGAAAFLASFAPFVLEHLDEPSGYMRHMLRECLESFITRALCRYPGTGKVGVVGSFGCACKDELLQAGSRHGLDFVKFVKDPIDELVPYHKNRMTNGL